MAPRGWNGLEGILGEAAGEPVAPAMDPMLAERLGREREAMKWERLIRAAEAAARAVVEAVRERRRRR